MKTFWNTQGGLTQLTEWQPNCWIQVTCPSDRRLDRRGTEVHGQGNQGLCRIHQKGQRCSSKGVQDTFQQRAVGRYGQQSQGHQKEHVQQGECRCPQSQDDIRRYEMGLELPPKLTQNQRITYLAAQQH